MSVEAFLNDIKSNATIMRLLGQPTQTINSFISEVQALKNNQRDKDYVMLQLADQDLGFAKVVNGKWQWTKKIGVVVSYYLQNLFTYPYDLQYDGTYLWVATDRGIQIYDNNFSFLGQIGVLDPTFTSGYYNVRGIYVATDKVFFTSDNHVIGALDKATGQLLWTFGVVNSPGTPDVGKLYTPRSIAIAPNGNILVANLNGGYNSYGYISEHDINTGAYIRTVFDGSPNGMPWNHSVHKPGCIRTIQRPEDGVWELWVAYWSLPYLAVFEYDSINGDWIYKTVYSKTEGMDIGDLRPRGFVIDSTYTYVYIAMDNAMVIAKVNIATHDMVGYVGEPINENFSHNDNTPGALFNLWGVALANGYVVVSDYGNRRLQVFPEEMFVTEPVEVLYTGVIPEFKKIEYVSDDRLDLMTLKLIDLPQNLMWDAPPEKIIVAGIL